MRALYGVQSIEAHQATGDQVRRIFYVDGYGRDLIAVTFLRPRRGAPLVSVHYPRQRSGEMPDALRIPVPRPVWAQILSAADTFERTVPGRGDPQSVCFHSWVWTIEMADPVRTGSRPPGVRREVEDACALGPGERYADALASAALTLLPACAMLDRFWYQDAATKLAACRILHGDRLAAAEVLNGANSFRRIERTENVWRIAALFDEHSALDWNGEHAAGAAGASFWIAHVIQNGSWASFYSEAVDGLGPDRVRLTGSLGRSTDTPRGTATGSESAHVEQIWVRRRDGRFVIERATVGPWEPYRPR
jgi:hypothetical protein